jgi:hypothetical protein
VKIRPVRTISRKLPVTQRSSSICSGSWASSTVEGCFSVSVHRNTNARSTGGWQLHPAFHYQHERYRAVLEALKTVFGCGRLRPKGPNSAVWTFAVDGLVALERHVLPFFERHPLVVKHADFQNFALIVRAMRRKEAPHERRVRTAAQTCLRDEFRRQATQPKP